MPVDIARVGQLVQFTQPEDGKISPEETAKLLDEIRVIKIIVGPIKNCILIDIELQFI